MTEIDKVFCEIFPEKKPECDAYYKRLEQEELEKRVREEEEEQRQKMVF